MMIKDAMEKNEKATPNGADLEVLKKHFGMCFNSDGSLDLEKLKARLGDQVAISNEGYELKFLGKNYARLLTSLETTTVVVPDKKHNAKPENAKSKNVYISGDNLDALKHLLKSKQGQVKCIYIDPPYNTGSDGFVYNDSFGFKVEELANKLSISEDEAQRILDFTKRGSASHSAWLMFMYSRLMLARELLAKEGVIFISIDDNEQANLKLMCDEVFGEENFLAVLARRTKSGGGSATDNFAVEHDYVLVYARTVALLDKLTIPFDEEYLKRYDEQDEKGRYFWDTMERSSTKTKPYIITAPDGTSLQGKWFRSEATFKEDKKTGEVRFLKKKDGSWSVQFKQRLGEGKNLRSLLTEEMQNDLMRDEYKSYSDDLEVLGLGGLFSYPKTVALVKYLLQVVKGQATVIDFFSGSATTAEAVMRLNLARMKGLDDGIQYIMVQLPENLDETLKHSNGERKEVCERAISFLDSIGRKHFLDEIGIERIKRAAAKIAAENPLLAKTMDLGFKHYTLKEVEGKTLDKIEKFDLNDNALAATDDILKEFGVETVLATWLVHDGYGFGAEPKVVDLDGYKAYWMEKHVYLIEPGLSDKGISALFDKFETEGSFNPGNVVVFGYSFSWTQLEALKNNLLKIAANGTNKHVLLDKRY